MRGKCWSSCCALLILGSTSWARAEEPPAPKVQIDGSIFDFGSVPEGQKVVHDFQVKNVGNADLKIDNIVPSCGCTASSMQDSVVKPGEEGTLHVEFDTTGFKGEKSKTVRLYTNDPNDPTSTVSLNGSVEVDVDIQPARLFFGDVVKGEEPSRDVTVKSSHSKIAKIETNSPFLKIEPKSDGDKERTFTLKLAPDTRAGEIRSRVIITLDELPPRVINVPVFASVKGPVQLKPSMVSFGVIEGDSVLERNVRLVNNGKTPIAIKEINSSDAAVTSEITAIQPGSTYVIHVRVDPSKVDSSLRAVLDIVTDNPENETLSLNVIGTVPAKL